MYPMSGAMAVWMLGYDGVRRCYFDDGVQPPARLPLTPCRAVSAWRFMRAVLEWRCGRWGLSYDRREYERLLREAFRAFVVDSCRDYFWAPQDRIMIGDVTAAVRRNQEISARDAGVYSS